VRVPLGRALAGTVAVVSVAAFGATYLLFFTPKAPPPVTLNDPQDQSPASARTEDFDPVGTWAVQEGSETGYRVREKLARLPAPSDAVGRTTAVTGGFELSGEPGRYSVSGIHVRVDVTKLASDSPRRDNALRERGLETDRYPSATFNSRGLTELPGDIGDGEPVDLTLDGEIMIHGVTRQVSIPVEAQLVSRRIQVVGSLTIPMADFGIEPPSIANIVAVQPTGTLEFDLILEKAV
jgi:polyisoprenoid-binding protein YceI